MVIVIMMTMIGALEKLWHYIGYEGRIKLTKPCGLLITTVIVISVN